LRMSRALRLLLILLLLGGLAAAVVAVQFNRFLNTGVSLAGTDEVFQIRSGASFREVSASLAEREVISRPLFFRIYARLRGEAGSVQAGEYKISQEDTPKSLLAKFVGGEVLLYSFTIVEGWNYRDLLRELAAVPELEATLTDEEWPALLEELGAEVNHPEGLFLPETYRFARGTRSAVSRVTASRSSARMRSWGSAVSGTKSGFPARVYSAHTSLNSPT